MQCYRLKKGFQSRAFHSFFLLWMLFSLNIHHPLQAENIIIENPDSNDPRTRTAYVLTGATIIGLAAVGVAYAASSSCSHHRCHSHSCCSSSSDSCSSSYSCCSSSSHSHCSSSSSYSCSDYFSNNACCSNLGLVDNLQNPQFPFRHQKSKTLRRRSREESSIEEIDTLSGYFVANPAGLSSESRGGMTAHVQLPNGTRQTLGHIFLSGKTTATLPYGPFKEEGNYVFSVTLDDGTLFSNQTKIGWVDIKVNDSKVQSHDFIVPAHARGSYEPAPCVYVLKGD